MLTTTNKYTIRKALPRPATQQSAVETLHHPPNMFSLSDVVVSHRKLPHDESRGQNASSYELEDAVSYLPFGLWDSTVKITVHFENLDDGILITKNVILGMTFTEHWVVHRTEETDRSGLELQVDVEMTGSKPVLALVSRYMRANHEKYLERMVDLIAKGGKGKDAAH